MLETLADGILFTACQKLYKWNKFALRCWPFVLYFHYYCHYCKQLANYNIYYFLNPYKCKSRISDERKLILESSKI